MRYIYEEARRPNNNHEAKATSSTVLARKADKIIDAEAQQEYRLALKLAELRAAREQSAPVIVAREVRV